MLGDSIKRRRGAKRRRRRAAPRSAGATSPYEHPGAQDGRLAWSRWILGGLATMAGAFGIGYAIAVFLVFPAPADAGDAIAVPDLVGESVSEAERILSAQGLVLGDVDELPRDREPRGIVLAQTPLAGQFLHAGAGVRLAVSAGTPRGVIPSVAGLTADEAEALLTRIGFEIDRRQRPARQPAGRVVRVEPRAGTEHDLSTRVVLIVSSGPPPVVVPDSVIPSTDPVLIPPLLDTIPLPPVPRDE